MTTRDREVTVEYTNWRGVRSERRVIPLSFNFEKNNFHPGPPQWLMRCLDTETNKERMFAMAMIHSWKVSA